MKGLPKIALGTWSWGVGSVGGDQVFGNHLEEQELKPVFDTAMEKGLNLWDTAVVYGMGASETILGKLASAYPREDVVYPPNSHRTLPKTGIIPWKKCGVEVVNAWALVTLISTGFTIPAM